MFNCNDFIQKVEIEVIENMTVSCWCRMTVTRYSVYVPVLHVIIVWRLPAFVPHRAIWEEKRRKCLGQQRKQDSSEDINNKSFFLSLYLFSKQDVLHIHTHHQEPQDARLLAASKCFKQQVRESYEPCVILFR